MKLIAILLATLSLVGCATNGVSYTQNYTSPALTYEQMANWKVSNNDCPRIDAIVNEVERSLSAKGLLYADPATLNDQDRKYNAYARSIVWALRIGCANPDRYNK